ncbi:MAG: hypothetical protein Q9192_006649, partial [Flavoplaca navasiana]
RCRPKIRIAKAVQRRLTFAVLDVDVICVGENKEEIRKKARDNSQRLVFARGRAQSFGEGMERNSAIETTVVESSNRGGCTGRKKSGNELWGAGRSCYGVDYMSSTRH